MDIQNAINAVMEQEQRRSPSLVMRSDTSHWTVFMPYRHKFSEKELKYLKQYGLEDFMLWQYSLYQETVWQSIRRKVKRLLDPSVVIDDWELHDDYIYETISVAEPSEKMTTQYFKRFKKMRLL